eukprot:CAMPEP_0117030228 /NCGR_PEP_ID=MMETSP0472-20121206/21832_1 /TAXON_ID=693140 ORGANISM="Tiarina fusus, Strain LIS" /NCGR_SAMPLE_ID=MMETSP0472 /ASSEMBLY_ACC=CAM_ASM_000603 /LENGTH=347 /DNA_ID=CAMNT_0004738235 /DNA_START=119 /DNA_END=1162 /DNA_ORIENTATION=+
MKKESAASKKAGKAPPAKAAGEKNKRKRRHKPKDFPKRPLSAYNIFFKETRESIIKEQKDAGDEANVDFQTMAKEIAARWKALPSDERERVDKLAKEDMERYREAVKTYEDEMVKRSRKEREETAAAEEKAAKQAAEDREEAAAAAAAEKAASAAAANAAAAQRQAAYPGAAAAAGSLAARNMDHSLLAAEAAANDSAALRNEQELLREQLAAMQHREMMQRQLLLMEELRAVEARAQQVRHLQFPGGLHGDYLGSGLQAAQLGYPSLAHESLLKQQMGLGGGFGGGYGGLPGAGAGLLGGHSDSSLAFLAQSQGGGHPDLSSMYAQEALLRDYASRLNGQEGPPGL